MTFANPVGLPSAKRFVFQVIRCLKRGTEEQLANETRIRHGPYLT